MQISYPYHLSPTGRSSIDPEDHVRDLIEQVLFTAPTERVNRPDFGTGLLELVFAAASDELVAATQFMVQGALQQWLGDLIEVEAVVVERDESRLNVIVQYLERRTQERHQAQFQNQ